MFVNNPPTNAEITEPEIGKDQVTVTMEKVGDEWLVDDMKTTLPSSLTRCDPRRRRARPQALAAFRLTWTPRPSMIMGRRAGESASAVLKRAPCCAIVGPCACPQMLFDLPGWSTWWSVGATHSEFRIRTRLGRAQHPR